MTERKKRIGLYAGSFDPFTVGHHSIVSRALEVTDEIVIGIGYNEHKGGSFQDIDTRLSSIRALYAGEPRVRVAAYTGLTAGFAKQEGATVLIRGVRSAGDFESERTLADVNREISGLDTILLLALPEYSYVSSTMVRELSHNGYDVSRFLPKKTKE